MMPAKIKAPLRKQAKSLTIKSAWTGIALAIVGVGVALDQLTALFDQRGNDMFTAKTMGWIMLALSLAKMTTAAIGWYGRYRIMEEPPADTPAEEKL
jgi:uncharacterized membrane protein YidH (DUF202 family)